LIDALPLETPMAARPRLVMRGAKCSLVLVATPDRPRAARRDFFDQSIAQQFADYSNVSVRQIQAKVPREASCENARS
jgi:hypothetical protein